MFAKLMRAFRPLDTSAVDAAIAEAACEHQQVRVRARALRMDVSCGDPRSAIGRVTARTAAAAGDVLRAVFEPGETPAYMHDLLGRM